MARRALDQHNVLGDARAERVEGSEANGAEGVVVALTREPESTEGGGQAIVCVHDLTIKGVAMLVGHHSLTAKCYQTKVIVPQT